MARFLGFKTNMGFDQYPAANFGFNNLFEPSRMAFSSDALTGPALVQGVYIPEDVGQMWEDDILLREICDIKI